MALVEEGRVCVKKFGRDAGERAVITKVIDASMVNVVTATRPKERKCNVKHLEFLVEKIDPKDKAQLYRALEIEEPKPKQAKPQAATASKQKK